ncbi:MAG TPA: DUF4276 family protein, partial [Polyangiaceae bacterium]|nr:DUF4276 family protein [Polyangiaceae bacterium]
MKRLLALVEGQTEEQFFQNLVAPHLGERGIDARATIVCTRRVRKRRAHRGGMPAYAKFKDELRRLFASKPDAVTTMIDFYALPTDYPGVVTLPSRAKTIDKQRHLHAALAVDVGDPRFIPNVVMHEYEAFGFVDLDVTTRV